MSSHEVLILVISLSLLFLSFNLFVTASEDTNSDTENCKSEPSKSFEEAWPVLQTAVDKLINRIEGVDNSSFTSEEYMLYYTTVYEFCTTRKGDENSKLLYDQYKKVFEEYVNSTVLPSLRGKKDEILLRELHKRWSNHKIMTRWLSRFFHYIDRYYIDRWNLPSLQEASFLSFYDLVHEETNKQVVDAVLSMINREHAGEQIDQALVNNVLAMYSEVSDMSRKYHGKGFEEEMLKNIASFYSYGAPYWITSHSSKDNLPQEEKLHDDPFIVTPSKKINLKSSDGKIFEVDYAVATMSETIKSIIESNSAGHTLALSKVSSKILAKVIEYCKKHIETSNHKKQSSDNDLKEWDAGFVEVDQSTLFDLLLTANYLNIKSLQDLTSQKIADMIKGKSPDEIRKIFNIKDDFAEQKEEVHKENQWSSE